MRNLIRCDFCGAEAFCVAFDETHAYYECAASVARHQWSEERDPHCARCREQLSEHRMLTGIDVSERHLVCPKSLKDNTFAYED